MDLSVFTMAVEQRFGLTIPDHDAVPITTPRKLIDYLTARLCEGACQPGCLTQRAFHLARRAFVSQLGTRRESVRPQAALAALVPSATRRQSWACLQAATNASSWPPLRRPAWLFWSLFGCGMGSAVAVMVALSAQLGFGPALLAAIASWIIVGIVLAKPITNWATEFAAPYVVIGDLTRFLLAFAPVEGVRISWTREQVASVVHALIIEVLGVVKYTDDSRWVEDMGVD